MTVGWCGAAISILLLLHSPEQAAAKKKIIKLIVPHKIKYLHHTHVLLVTPKKKLSHKFKDEIGEDESNYHRYIHDTRSKVKPHVHYVLPIVAQSKKSLKKYKSKRPPHSVDELDPYRISDYHKSISAESDALIKALSSSKGATLHRGLRVPYEAEPFLSQMKLLDKPRYVFKEPLPSDFGKPPYSFETAPSEEMFASSLSYPSLPEHFEYSPTSAGVDPNGLTPEEGGWGAPPFSVPEKTTSIRNYYKDGYFEPAARFNR